MPRTPANRQKHQENSNTSDVHTSNWPVVRVIITSTGMYFCKTTWAVYNLAWWWPQRRIKTLQTQPCIPARRKKKKKKKLTSVEWSGRRMAIRLTEKLWLQVHCIAYCILAAAHFISTSPALPLRGRTWPSNAEVVSLLENFARETHRKLHPDGVSQKIAAGKWSTPWTRAF
jgi:hypothetical protein